MAAPDPHLTPGFLTPQAAAALQAGLAQTEANRRAIERLVPEGDELIPAKVTGTAGSGSGSTSGAGDDVTYLAWVEQAYDRTGGRYDKPGGLSGTAAWMPARHPNGESIGAFPLHCFVRRTTVTGRGPEYEIVAGGAGGQDGSFLAVITDKRIGGPFIAYTWAEVEEGGGFPNTPPYRYKAGGRSGDPDNMPLYHVQDIDLVAWIGQAASGSGAGDIPRECVFRIRKGAGAWYLFDSEPRWEFVERTADWDAAGEALGRLVQYNQRSRTWVATQFVLVVDVNGGVP